MNPIDREKTAKEEQEVFEGRKRDHIRLALDGKTQTLGQSDLEQVELIHEALPDINFEEVCTETSLFSQTLKSPFFVSCMTAGHGEASAINTRLASAAQKRGWAMGVGSQRKELSDPQAAQEWEKVRELAPDVPFLGNIGIAQLIQTPLEKIETLVKNLGASAMVVHLNPLQECFQPEGTVQFRGGFKALKELSQCLSVPVIVKETGCGFSQKTLEKLCGLGLFAVDVSGLGGTHWGRVEGLRAENQDVRSSSLVHFKDWGISTVQSLVNAHQISGSRDYRLWASGGVRSGLDGAKLLALGAQMIGVAMPLMKAAVDSEEAVLQVMDQLQFELQVAMFCTGCKTLDELSHPDVWSFKGE